MRARLEPIGLNIYIYIYRVLRIWAFIMGFLKLWKKCQKTEDCEKIVKWLGVSKSNKFSLLNLYPSASILCKFILLSLKCTYKSGSGHRERFLYSLFGEGLLMGWTDQRQEGFLGSRLFSSLLLRSKMFFLQEMTNFYFLFFIFFTHDSKNYSSPLDFGSNPTHATIFLKEKYL
jgi:hypothetical protein